VIVKTSFAMLRLILVLVGAAAYGGLAILGWGGFRPSWDNNTTITARLPPA
jgi:hypothetical protein